MDQEQWPVDREGLAVTISEIEAWLKSTYPNKDFTVSEKLGIGLPMWDNVMLYVRTDKDYKYQAAPCAGL